LDRYEARLKARGDWSPLRAQKLGLLHENARNYSGARRLYLEALELKPNDPAIFLHLGLLCEAQGLTADAVQNYAQVLRLGTTFSAELRDGIVAKMARLQGTLKS